VCVIERGGGRESMPLETPPLIKSRARSVSVSVSHIYISLNESLTPNYTLPLGGFRV
jgi:hypothetical protein